MGTPDAGATLSDGMDVAQQLATLAVHRDRREVARRLEVLDHTATTAVTVGLLDVVVAIHHAWSAIYKLDTDDMLEAWSQIMFDLSLLRDERGER